MNGASYILDDHLAARVPGIRGMLGRHAPSISRVSSGELLNGIGTMPLNPAAEKGATSTLPPSMPRGGGLPPATVSPKTLPPITVNPSLPKGGGSGAGPSLPGGGYRTSDGGTTATVQPPAASDATATPTTGGGEVKPGGVNPWFIVAGVGIGIIALMAYAGRSKR